MRRLSGHTTHYAVLGHPIGHSLSPVMHNASFASLDLDAVYLAFDVQPELLMNTLPSMRDMGFRGVNLTVPLKEVAFRGIKNLDDSARMLGAVNTVEFLPDGTLKGHNTDGTGFLLAIKEAFGKEIKDLSIFVLGSGGAGRAVAITCAMHKAGKVSITDMDPSRSQKTAEEIRLLAPDIQIDVIPSITGSWIEASKAADLVIQATPVGMKQSDQPLLGPEAFRKGQYLFDLIYMYPMTGIMKSAATSGAKTANGLGMLLHQGAHAFKIWSGKNSDVNAMRNALESEVYKDA